MSKRAFYVPPEGPPQGGLPSPEIYAKMGEANIFAMMSDFYKELEQSPLRSMFPENMQEASEKSALFFVFLLGGPPLYQQKFGHPMMRQRHLPFEIDETARQIWLNCFKKVLENGEKYQFPAEHKDNFFNFLERFSGWMVNIKQSGS
jgi:hemoglobin